MLTNGPYYKVIPLWLLFFVCGYLCFHFGNSIWYLYISLFETLLFSLCSTFLTCRSTWFSTFTFTFMNLICNVDLGVFMHHQWQCISDSTRLSQHYVLKAVCGFIPIRLYTSIQNHSYYFPQFLLEYAQLKENKKRQIMHLNVRSQNTGSEFGAFMEELYYLLCLKINAGNRPIWRTRTVFNDIYNDRGQTMKEILWVKQHRLSSQPLHAAYYHRQ